MDRSKTFNKKASRFFVWSVYILIFFEMIYMSTPFAVFFYSVYGMPLKFLSQSNTTAWLTQNILPHFTQTQSVLINTLLYISWPLMGLGFVIFIIGFCQVYWAKFRRKGPVLGGLYRFIRHPQYAAWAIFGLGMAIFWSRMIVWIMYVTMLFVYYLLAVSEERECLTKYGDSYLSYFQKTGRFFPKIRKKTGTQTSSFMPQKGPVFIAAFVLLYLIALFGTMSLGFHLRDHVFSQISMISDKDTAVVSLIPMERDRMKNITAIALNDPIAKENLNTLQEPLSAKRLIYIMPVSWHVPELAMEEKPGHGNRHGFNPTSHGNPTVTDRNRYKVLISKAVVDKGVQGKGILSEARRQTPLLIVKVDLKKNRASGIEKPPPKGKYGDLPVPLF